MKLLQEINKQALKYQRKIDCLLQVYIAREETKFGLDESELYQVFTSPELSSLTKVSIKGLMGMASFSDDTNVVRSEFAYLKTLYNKYSMGMSSDYRIAVEEGSNMVRIGSLIFGERS